MINRERGVIPRLSRSCESLYSTEARKSTAPSFYPGREGASVWDVVRRPALSREGLPLSMQGAQAKNTRKNGIQVARSVPCDMFRGSVLYNLRVLLYKFLID